MKMLFVFMAASVFAADLDPRLPLATLVREDLFAAFMSNDMSKFEIGRRNLEKLIAERPAERPRGIAWRGAVEMYLAIRALEGGDRDGYAKLYAAARESFAEAARMAPDNFGVIAPTAAAAGYFADRLASEDRTTAWELSYVSFKKMAEVQMPMLDKLPLHFKGELLAGLAQSAQRTGRKEEAQRYLAQMAEQLAGSPYEPLVKKWLSDPALANRTSLACKSCHEPGRLQSRLRELDAAR